MIHIARWKIILILAVCAFGILYSLPNVIGAGARESMAKHLPSFLPSKTINLGLDLQGGSHLLLQVDLDNVVEERAEGILRSLRPELRKEKIGYRRLSEIKNGIRVTLRDAEDADQVKKIIRGLDNNLEVSLKGGNVEAVFSDLGLKDIQDQTINQSIEIVRRRIDETGTREPIIQRQGDDVFLFNFRVLMIPQKLKRCWVRQRN